MGLRGPVVLALCAVLAAAQDWPKELPAAGREALRRDGVWVGPKTFPQVFDAYNNPPCPIFVSTDGPIVAGYRLMEQTIMRMERWSFAKLPRGLRELEAKLGEAERTLKLPSETAAAASRRARLVVAVARLLLGETPEGLDDATLARARECAALVERADGRSMPPGLGPPDRTWLGFDWRVFRPHGPYAGDPCRERAFRATRWLQSVPFRPERTEEDMAFLLLWEARRNTAFWPAPLWAVKRRHSGDLLPLTLESSAFAPLHPRTTGHETADTDLLHETPRTGAMRLVPRLDLPEDRLLFALLHPSHREPVPGAGFPAGLAIAAALGSPIARAADPSLADARHDLSGAAWTDAANGMRAALLDGAEPDAPPLFSTPAWERKSLRTALGSWVLERNLWASHAGPVMSVFGGPRQCSGLVEPDPGTFAELADMGRAVLRWTQDEELDGEAMRIEYADGLFAYVRGVVAELEQHRANPLVPTPEQLIRTLRNRGVLDPAEYDRISSEAQRRIGDAAAASGDIKAEFRAAFSEPILAACERWHARMIDLTVQLDGPVGEPLGPRWERWVALCVRLELLAHKQLRERTWRDGEEAFLKGYGVELGEVMGYPVGSLQHPADDAPRAASVICDPLNDVMRIVGTGRPRELWVLYPYRGKEIVCRGVVLSYYEIDAREVPTDAEWKAMLDSKEPPREPTWLTGEQEAERASGSPRSGG